MGASFSVEELVFKINDLASDLQTTYNYKYLSPDFCNSFELIYDPNTGINDEHFIKYEDDDYPDNNATLGYVANAPDLKIKVCQDIQNHYKLRVQIIQAMLDNLDVCVQKSVMNQSNDVLLRMLEILNQFKDFNEDIDDEMLASIKNEVYQALIPLCKLPQKIDTSNGDNEKYLAKYGVLMNAEEIRRKLSMRQARTGNQIEVSNNMPPTSLVSSSSAGPLTGPVENESSVKGGTHNWTKLNELSNTQKKKKKKRSKGKKSPKRRKV